MKECNLFDLLAAGEPECRVPRKDTTFPETLERVAAEALACSRCDLRKNATQVVFGDGNPKATLMFVGEGPGAEEDRQGLPFVGAAGQLLNRILAAAGFAREEVYIANIVKCRPPGNRLPLRNEVEACLPFLKRQIAIIKPKIIVCLGSLAAQTLLETRLPIGRLRGRFADKDGIRIMPTYHPAALLRDPSKKRPVWEDMKLVRDLYREIT